MLPGLMPNIEINELFEEKHNANDESTEDLKTNFQHLLQIKCSNQYYRNIVDKKAVDVKSLYNVLNKELDNNLPFPLPGSYNVAILAVLT